MRRLGWFGVTGLLVLAGTGCNPSIARIRGEVVSVERTEETYTICLSNAVEAGSTYAKDRHLDDPECWWGSSVDGDLPSVGDCVRLTMQGESDELGVEAVTGCEHA